MSGDVEFDVSDGATNPRCVPPGYVSVTHQDTTDGPLLVVQGTLSGGSALDDLGSALAAALESTAADVVVDLAAVEDWSLLAQAMILNSARLLARRGRRLLLVGASAELVQSSRRLGVFDTLLPQSSRPTPQGQT